MLLRTSALVARSMRIVHIPCLQDNYSYLIIDESTKKAEAGDPVEPEKVLKVAKDNGADLKMILLSALDSKDWITICEALNNVRRFTVFHKEILLEMLQVFFLENVIPLVVKSLKNPRSALCKTAIMTSSDIFSAYGDNMVDSLDPLLVQLLLKASQDKRFECEAAERALIAMTTSVSPALLLPKLQPNLKHKSPRIRAKASMCFCKSVPRLIMENAQWIRNKAILLTHFSSRYHIEDIRLAVTKLPQKVSAKVSALTEGFKFKHS